MSVPEQIGAWLILAGFATTSTSLAWFFTNAWRDPLPANDQWLLKTAGIGLLVALAGALLALVSGIILDLIGRS